MMTLHISNLLEAEAMCIDLLRFYMRCDKRLDSRYGNSISRLFQTQNEDLNIKFTTASSLQRQR